MENSEFELLQQRDIINTMIDGKFLPYLSANNIKDLGMQFGYNLKKNERTSKSLEINGKIFN